MPLLHPEHVKVLDAERVVPRGRVEMKTPEQVKAFHEEQAKIRAAERERAKAKAAANAKSAEQEAEYSYRRDIAVVEGALSEILGTDPHEEITEFDRRAVIAMLAQQFRAQIEFARQKRNALAPAVRHVEPVHAWQAFYGALVVVLGVSHARLTEVQIGDATYLLAPGENYLPADIVELGALEGMIARGQATLHPPGTDAPEVSAAVRAAREMALRDFGGA